MYEQEHVLIAPTTDADTALLYVPRGMVVPVTVNDLGASEVIAVEIDTPNGWQQYKSKGVSIQLSASQNKLGFDIPGRYRLNKPETVAAVGILREAL
jgi:hypothetical protein